MLNTLPCMLKRSHLGVTQLSVGEKAVIIATSEFVSNLFHLLNAVHREFNLRFCIVTIGIWIRWLPSCDPSQRNVTARSPTNKDQLMI